MDDSSFRDFVDRQEATLLRTGYLLTGDRGLAEDLVQTALLATYRHWDRLLRRGDPTAYVRRVLVTTHTSWRRRLSSRELVLHPFPDRAAPVAEETARSDDLHRALLDLPPRMRAVLVLRYLEDRSEMDTAQLMGCSVSTVSTQASRGLGRLRGLLTPSPVAEEPR